jgi:hypothetical protein
MDKRVLYGISRTPLHLCHLRIGEAEKMD